MPVLQLDGSDPIRLPDVGGHPASVGRPLPGPPLPGPPLPDFSEEPATQLHGFAPVPMQMDEEDVTGQVGDELAGRTVVASPEDLLLPPPVPPVFSRPAASDSFSAAADLDGPPKKRGGVRLLLIGGAIVAAVGIGVFGAHRVSLHLEAKAAQEKASQLAAAPEAAPVKPNAAGVESAEGEPAAPPPTQPQSPEPAAADAGAEAPAAVDPDPGVAKPTATAEGGTPASPEAAGDEAGEPVPAAPEAAKLPPVEPPPVEPPPVEPQPAKPPPPAEPEPVAVPPVSEGPHQALLEKATAAFEGDKIPAAYTAASESFDAKPTKAALLMMVRSACAMESAAKAQAAYSKLALSSRPAIRKECLALGVDLGS